MSSYFRRASTFFALIALVPFVVGFLSSWQVGVGFVLFILGMPIVFLILLLGATIWLIRGIRLTHELTSNRDKLLVLSASPLFLVSVILIAWPLLATGSFLGSMSRLLVNHGHYEAIIAKVRAHPKPSWFEEDGGVTYSVDLGPPIRVAFNPAGMLDNWSGIIYDPTGDVMLADGFDPLSGKFAAPDRVTKLFYGDLVSCRHLWGSYYECSFT